MKKKTSQKILRSSKNMISSTKQLPRQNSINDSLKAPKRKPNRKNRKFGDDITNMQKQPVFQQMDVQEQPVMLYSSKPLINQIQPYLSQITSHLINLDSLYTSNFLYRLSVKPQQSNQITLDMRKILIKWIIQVAQKFKASNQTIHISAQIIDYILIHSQNKITKFNFQLLGISSLFVASKYNQIYTPQAKKYVFVCDGLYTLDDLFQMESYILTLTNFNLQFPSVYDFLGPVINNDNSIGEEYKKTVDIVTKIIVMDFALLNKYKKAHLSGVILYFCSKVLNYDKFNSKQIMQKMKIDQQTFKNCFNNIVLLYKQCFKTNSNQNKNS